jgi:serine/threonine protein kinase
MMLMLQRCDAVVLAEKQNVLLDGQGRAKVADFGISRCETRAVCVCNFILQWASGVVVLLDSQGRAKIADFGISRYEALLYHHKTLGGYMCVCMRCMLLLDGQGRAKIADFGISRYETSISSDIML